MVKNLVSGTILACFDLNSVPKFSCMWVLPLLDVIYCCKLSLHVISRKTNEPNLRKWQKKISGPILTPSPHTPNFFSWILLQLNVKDCGKLSLYSILVPKLA